MLHAERSICVDANARPSVGTIVVHVVFDYRTLPFITSQSPVLRRVPPDRTARRVEGPPASESNSRSTAGG